MSKNILITGASTGIGFDCVRALVAADFHVVATVRKNEDLANLKNLYGEKVSVLILDVSDFDQVEKLPAQLKKNGITDLAGLVNNAGLALAGPFLNQPFSEIQQMIQVNVLSVMKVTQVLLPLISMGKPGRIINISSVAGKSAAPFLSAYAASKHAIEGFSEGLRREMMLLGVDVVVVGPGSIKTPIWQKGFGVIQEKYSQSIYADSFKKFVAVALNEEKNALEVSEVSKVVVQALLAKKPALRYAPIPRKWMNWYLPKLIPTKLYDQLVAKALGLKAP